MKLLLYCEIILNNFSFSFFLSIYIFYFQLTIIKRAQKFFYYDDTFPNRMNKFDEAQFRFLSYCYSDIGNITMNGYSFSFKPSFYFCFCLNFPSILPLPTSFQFLLLGTLQEIYVQTSCTVGILLKRDTVNQCKSQSTTN